MVTYYVKATATAGGKGLTPSTAFATLQQAADVTNPGDTVYVMDGVYTNPNTAANVMTITRSGTADRWITYTAYPGHRPKILSRNWHGICVQGASYIRIKGFEVEGNAMNLNLPIALALQMDLKNPLNSGNGIGITPSLTGKRSHHIDIFDNIVHHHPGGGIYTLQADYVRIETNQVYNNAWYSPWACSGISLFQNWNSDPQTSVKMVVRNNTVWGNYNYIPFWMTGTITDGNGIIVDDSQNTLLGSTLPPYQGQTLIAANTCYENGGNGVTSYRSNYVVALDNQVQNNLKSPNIVRPEYTTGLIQQGTERGDRLMGTAIDDCLLGGKGNDWLAGTEGTDALVGGPGKDVLMGGSGDDYLIGGGGSDRLIGGPGRDWFILGAVEQDVIYRFDVGQDRFLLPPGVSADMVTFKLTREGPSLLIPSTQTNILFKGSEGLSWAALAASFG